MTKIIILAAGQGKRMASNLPKVLVPLKNKPIIEYLLNSVKKSNVDKEPIIIVSPKNKEIIEEKLAKYNFKTAIQKEQLGTGHAVACAKDLIKSNVKKVIVLYGDHPFIKSTSIEKLAKLEFSALAIMPTILADFSNWRQNFYHWGRIIRNKKNEVEKIVEFKDASLEERKVLEVNPGIMAFNTNWLFEHIEKLRNNNKQKEYYLTDMVKLAFKEGQIIKTINISPEEAIGINSQKELEIATSLL